MTFTTNHAHQRRVQGRSPESNEKNLLLFNIFYLKLVFWDFLFDKKF